MCQLGGIPTYTMLEGAINYPCAFNSLTFNDRSYMLCLSNEEWERVEKMCAFLAPFYHITNLIFESSYPTSNLCFMQVYSIQKKLNENLYNEDEVIKYMVARMKVKFAKYWSEYSITLALGCVLDSRSKLNFLSFCYKRLYPYDHQEKVNRLKEDLYKLFAEYTKYGAASSSIASFQTTSSLMTMGAYSKQCPPMTTKPSSTSSMTSILDVSLSIIISIYYFPFYSFFKYLI